MPRTIFMRAENLFKVGSSILLIITIIIWVYLMVTPGPSIFGILLGKRVPIAGLKKDLSIIAYFLTSMKQLQVLPDSIRSVFINFNSRFQHPIVIFHSQNIDQKSLNSLLEQKLDSQTLQYIEVEGVILNDTENINADMQARFWVRDVFHHPRLLLYNVTYILRVSHLYVLSNEIKFDLFKYMQQLNLYYAYNPGNPIEADLSLAYIQDLIPFIYLYGRHERLLPYDDPGMSWINNLQLYEYEMGEGEKRIGENSFELLHVPSCGRPEFVKQWYADFVFDWEQNFYVWPSSRGAQQAAHGE